MFPLGPESVPDAAIIHFKKFSLVNTFVYIFNLQVKWFAMVLLNYLLKAAKDILNSVIPFSLIFAKLVFPLIFMLKK